MGQQESTARLRLQRGQEGVLHKGRSRRDSTTAPVTKTLKVRVHSEIVCIHVPDDSLTCG